MVGRKAGRNVACHWASFSTLLFSFTLNIIAAAVPSHSSGMVALRVSRTLFLVRGQVTDQYS